MDLHSSKVSVDQGQLGFALILETKQFLENKKSRFEREMRLLCGGGGGDLWVGPLVYFDCF
jgi:hypothetical protein